MNNKLQLIREKCIEANPESWMKARHCERDGTMYGPAKGTGTIVFPFQCPECGGYSYGDLEKKCGLADVLLVMSGSSMENEMIYDGDGDRRSTINLATLLCSWNLRADDLEKQSEECINFLYELLK